MFYSLSIAIEKAGAITTTKHTASQIKRSINLSLRFASSSFLTLFSASFPSFFRGPT